jgi:peptidoglycan/xylan/chitin deacetylase (PgdA/CDA1 family)
MSNEGKYTIIDLASFKNSKVVCLTLDVEQDYGDLLDKPSYEGLQHIPDLVNLFKGRNIPLTCFVQGSLFETHPSAIEQLSALDVEFEVHAYSHPKPREINHELEISRGKAAFTKFLGREPMAYRSPCGVVDEKMFSILPLHGFKFDSSVVPSVRPGAFNSLNRPTKPYFFNDSGVVEIPVTVVSNLIRIPISLSYIRLLGRTYFYLLRSIKLPKLIIFNFHLHDLYTLGSSKNIPFGKFPVLYRAIFRRIYTRSSDNGMGLLQDLINLFSRKGYRFLKLIDVYRLISGESPS